MDLEPGDEVEVIADSNIDPSQYTLSGEVSSTGKTVHITGSLPGLGKVSWRVKTQELLKEGYFDRPRRENYILYIEH